MTPTDLLADLATTRVGLAPSPIHGIGVFALADIPAGTRDLFAPPADWVPVPDAEVEKLPPHVRQLVHTYCLWDAGVYYLPPHGFRVMDVVMYLNHSDTPNLRQIDGGDYFETLRDVAAGEELTVDYTTFAT
ncbi:MAG: SET domain-containing protein-lysine N-methyltransferase [Fimbriiglobus sp.]|nr:SET domain-containing protein-lysine N-methyltransferase [Fimbriiglobus sp.]